MKKYFVLIAILSSYQAFSQCWDKVVAGTQHSIAIKQDSTLWAWGNNDHLQLGQGHAGRSLLPVEIGNDNDWVKIYAGEFASFAIKANGTLWGWGANYSGEVGNGTSEGVFFPEQIGTDTKWKQLSYKADHTAAVKTDGTLWAWGNNSYNQLGYFFSSPVPQRVGIDADWKTVSAGIYNTFAIKANGTLWAWGTNAGGSFGTGVNPYFGEDGYSVPIPTQVGTDTDWGFISVGDTYVAAIKPTERCGLGGQMIWASLATAQLPIIMYLNK